MGRPKLLLPWGDSTVLESTLAALRDGGVSTNVVVLAPRGPLEEWRPPSGVRTAVNPDPASGMLSSVLVDFAALSAPAPDPLLVCPADLPALRASTVTALLAAYRECGGIVVPRHGRRRGHPLLISPRWQARMPELAHHQAGLRRILELAAGVVHELAVDDPGCIRDVETPRTTPRFGKLDADQREGCSAIRDSRLGCYTGLALRAQLAMDTSITASVVHALRSALEPCEQVRLAILFGSQARERTRPDSDFDILLSLDSEDRESSRAVDTAIIDAVGSNVHIVYQHEAPPLLRLEIARHSVVLNEAREGDWVGFKRQAMVDWWDWAPIAKRIDDAAIKRLRENVARDRR